MNRLEVIEGLDIVRRSRELPAGWLHIVEQELGRGIPFLFLVTPQGETQRIGWGLATASRPFAGADITIVSELKAPEPVIRKGLLAATLAVLASERDAFEVDEGVLDSYTAYAGYGMGLRPERPDGRLYDNMQQEMAQLDEDGARMIGDSWTARDHAGAIRAALRDADLNVPAGTVSGLRGISSMPGELEGDYALVGNPAA